MKFLGVLLGAFCAFQSWAGVYKCTDAEGHTEYRSSPCTEEARAVEIDVRSGSQVDLTELERQQKQKEADIKQREQQQETLDQARQAAIAARKQAARAQSDITQALIKNQPAQFSAFAIPPYDPEDLPSALQPFEERLPDIEKFRRLSAQKALATGRCQRVEADELNAKSTRQQLVFLVNCSSGASYYFTESELAK